MNNSKIVLCGAAVAMLLGGSNCNAAAPGEAKEEGAAAAVVSLHDAVGSLDGPGVSDMDEGAFFGRVDGLVREINYLRQISRSELVAIEEMARRYNALKASKEEENQKNDEELRMLEEAISKYKRRSKTYENRIIELVEKLKKLKNLLTEFANKREEWRKNNKFEKMNRLEAGKLIANDEASVEGAKNIAIAIGTMMGGLDESKQAFVEFNAEAVKLLKGRNEKEEEPENGKEVE